jgi:hypothetical protein
MRLHAQAPLVFGTGARSRVEWTTPRRLSTVRAVQGKSLIASAKASSTA